jgi:hypothetical protein
MTTSMRRPMFVDATARSLSTGDSPCRCASCPSLNVLVVKNVLEV